MTGVKRGQMELEMRGRASEAEVPLCAPRPVFNPDRLCVSYRDDFCLLLLLDVKDSRHNSASALPCGCHGGSGGRG